MHEGEAKTVCKFFLKHERDKSDFSIVEKRRTRAGLHLRLGHDDARVVGLDDGQVAVERLAEVFDDLDGEYVVLEEHKPVVLSRDLVGALRKEE